jgi:hypothetical protein
MRRATWAALATAVGAVAAGSWALAYFGALGTEVAARVGAGLAVAVVLGTVLPAVLPGGPGGPSFEDAVRAPVAVPSGGQPASFERIERDLRVATSQAGASHLHWALRPVLRELAAHFLLVRRGVDLDASPDEAHALLGDELWGLVRADRPEPRDRHGPGLRPQHLGPIVERLEGL